MIVNKLLAQSAFSSNIEMLNSNIFGPSAPTMGSQGFA